MNTSPLQAAILFALMSTTHCVAAASPQPAPAQGAVQHYQIASGGLDGVLRQWSAQSRVQLVYPPELVEGRRSEGLSGSHTPSEALRLLLRGSDLEATPINARTIGLRASPRPAPASPRARIERPTSPAEDSPIGMPALMVKGARTLNTDITRTRDDPQPYVVFDRDTIERAGASSLEQFLQQRLPMNTSVASVGSGMQLAGGGTDTAASKINLRGLGASQTLILVDGHRMSSPFLNGGLTQGEITGIPLASIERIEILPTTASGIYGGSATGGVINIITRKDYTGGEVRLTYDNSFDTDSATRKVDVTFGRSFNQGRTNLLASGSYSDANDLMQADRNLLNDGRRRVLENSPDYFIGNPPIGATPNISSLDGSPLSLADGTPLNASRTWVPYGYAGVASDAGQALVANAGRYNWDLANNALGTRQSLYTQPTVKSGSLVLRHKLDEDTQLYMDLSSSETTRRFITGNYGTTGYLLPAGSPSNPFDQAVRISVPLFGLDTPQTSSISNQRAVLGIVKSLPHAWQMSADYTWDRTEGDYFAGEHASGLEAAFANGDIDALRDMNQYPQDFSPFVQSLYRGSNQSLMKDANLRFSGPLGTLGGGPAILSTAIAHRTEEVPANLSAVTSVFHAFYPSRSVSVSSAYLEYRMPFVSAKNARPGLKALELQLAVRGEDYVSRSGQMSFLSGEVPVLPTDIPRARNAFSSIDPTIALRWKPIDDLALRASYGTGFLPPGLGQLVPVARPAPITWGVDPRRGDTAAGPYARITDGDPDLAPEGSRSWSAGLVYTPAVLPDLRISLDYTRIHKTDAIGYMPGGLQGLIDNEALFPDHIVRGERLAGDPADWAGPIVLIRSTPMNLASTRLEAWDFQVDWHTQTDSIGAFDFFIAGTWQPHYMIQAVSGADFIEYAGIGSNNPLKLKTNLGVTWTLGPWRAGWNASYFDSYRIRESDPWNPWASGTASQGNGGRVASQTYHDVFVSYDFRMSGRTIAGWLGGTQLQFGIRNVFNTSPPFDATNALAFYSPFGSARLATYYLSATVGF